MENKYKTGYALKDKDIKFIKNYCKTLEIKTKLTLSFSNKYPNTSFITIHSEKLF